MSQFFVTDTSVNPRAPLSITGDGGTFADFVLNNVNIIGGPGISVVGDDVNTLTISETSPPFVWNVETTTPVVAVVNNGYITNESSATCVIDLPAVAAVGATISITNISSTHNWQAQANTGQTITMGIVSSSTAGTATSTANGDTITLICTVANTNWQVISSIGNITLA